MKYFHPPSAAAAAAAPLLLVLLFAASLHSTCPSLGAPAAAAAAEEEATAAAAAAAAAAARQTNGAASPSGPEGRPSPERAAPADAEDEESDFDDSPAELPIPTAFAPRPPAAAAAAAAPPPQQQQQKPPARPPPSPLHASHAAAHAAAEAAHAALQWVMRYKVLDFGAFLLFLVMAVTALKGKAENAEVATRWLQGVRDLLGAHFAAVSVATKGAILAKSYSCFELFCSGRRNCMFMLATINCVPRHCLWRGHLLRRLCCCCRDTVTLEFLLPEGGEGLVVNICKREEQRSSIEEAWDILEFCKVRHASSVASQLPEGFVLMSDTQEAAERLLEAAALQRHLLLLAPHLRCMYTSDLCTNTNKGLAATIATVYGSATSAPNKPKRVLRMTYSLPEKEDDFDPRIPLAVAFKVLDALANIKLSDASREAVRKMRMAYEKEQNKQRRKEQEEAAGQRRIERQREKEKALESLPEDQRRKAENAMERRQAKERRPNVKLIKA